MTDLILTGLKLLLLMLMGVAVSALILLVVYGWREFIRECTREWRKRK